MARKKHLIIGAGTAGLSALEKIRAVNSEDEVKLVTMEDCPPYSPASLPYLLSGKITEAKLWMEGEDYFKKLKSTLVKGKQVSSVVPEKRQVVYHDSTSENYDFLLIAAGAETATPPVKGLAEVGALGFRTLADCRKLIQALNGKKDVAILGAGSIGMEVASVLLGRGCHVTIIEKEPGIVSLCYSEEAEVYIRQTFMDRGAEFLTGKTASEVKKKNGRVEIAFSDGKLLRADILVNAAGVRSRTSFLVGSGIKVNSGIVTDNRMRTSADRIYAAGDVAEPPDFFTQQQKVSAILPSAVNQGKVAGANMAGQSLEYEGGIPMTVSNFQGHKAFSIGMALPCGQGYQVIKQTDDQSRKFKKLVFDGERLVGAMYFNENIEPGVIVYLIKKRADISAHKEALFERTRPLTDPWLSSLKFSPAGR